MSPRAKKGAVPDAAPTTPTAMPDPVLPAGMERLELPRRRVSLAGRVSDAVTGRPLAGARVEIVDAPGEWTTWAAARATELAGRTPPGTPPGLATTGADGWFRFLDLPAGPYTVAVSLPALGSRYAAGGATAPVDAVAAGRGWADASLTLAPTTLEGRVTDAAGGPVAMADVRVKGSLESAVTDGDGRFRITGVETGARVVAAAARGVGSASATVRLAQPGETARVTLALAPS